MCGEGRARVHEHPHKHGHDGKRNDVDAQEVVAHEQRQHHGEERYEHIEHGYASRFLKIVAAEEHEIGCEDDDHDAHIENLSDERACELVLGGYAAVELALKGAEHTVGILVHDVAAVNDLLTAHDHAAGGRYAAQQVVLLGLAALAVVDEVGLQIVGEVTF